MQEQNHKTVWVVDPVHTKIRFTTKYLLITYVSGWFTQMEGVIRASMDDFTDAQVQLTIYTYSIDTGNKERDQHLRSADFFDAKKYPQISFESTAVTTNGTTLTMSGILQIKDIVVATSFKVKHTGTVLDPSGNVKAGFTMKTTLNRMDLNLGWNNFYGNKGILLADEVKIFCDMQLLKISY